jgi:hypothetical protein
MLIDDQGATFSLICDAISRNNPHTFAGMFSV